MVWLGVFHTRPLGLPLVVRISTADAWLRQTLPPETEGLGCPRKAVRSWGRGKGKAGPRAGAGQTGEVLGLPWGGINRCPAPTHTGEPGVATSPGLQCPHQSAGELPGARLQLSLPLCNIAAACHSPIAGPQQSWK